MTKKTRNRQTEKAMYLSIVSTLLCVAMLIGMTFAWFTSTVESSQNVITTASFDVDVLWSDDISTIYATSQSALESTKWHDLDKTSTITNNNSQPFNELSFLPGQEVVRYIAMYNKSAFDVKFDVSLRAITDNTTTSDALLNALEIYTVVPVTANNPVTSAAMTKQGTAAELQKPGDALTQVSSSVVAGITEANTEKVTVMAISVKLPESYSYSDSQTVNFYIKVIASQWDVEHEEVSASYSTTGGTVIRAPQATVTVPAGAKTVDNQPIANGDTLTLTVEPGEADSNLTVEAGNGTTTYEVNLTNQNNVKVKSDEGIIVELDIGIVELHGFYHNATALTAVDDVNSVTMNKYYYNQSTGIITFMTDSFSPFTAKYKFSGGLGTSAAPYKIDSVKVWKDFADLCATDSTYSVTAGKYFSVTSDIDVSDITTRANIHYFAGHINFNNKSVSGFNSSNAIAADINDDGLAALFSMIKGDVVIENLKFSTSNIGTVAFSVAGVSFYNGVSICFKNIDINGVVTGATGNNNSLLLPYIYKASTNIECINCNNYATVIGSGYRSVFIGNAGYATASSAAVNQTELSFDNCHNYGTVISTNRPVAMMVANSGYPSQDIKVTIKNCSNEGTLAGITSSTLLVNNVDGTASRYKLTEGSDEITGNQPVILNTTVLGTSDGKFVLNTTENADRYELAFAFCARSHAGGNVGYTLGFKTIPSESFFVGNWITKEEAEALETPIVTHTEYGGTYYTCGENYVFYEDGARFEWGRQVVVTFSAYDASGNLLSIATYTYPYIP